jgi:hypothetical protein
VKVITGAAFAAFLVKKCHMEKLKKLPEKKDRLTLDKKAEEYLRRGGKIEGMPNLKDKEERRREIREATEREKR